MLLVQLKAEVVNPIFISVSYLGKPVSHSNGIVVMKDACLVYEMALTDDNKNTSIKQQYFMNSLVSVGELTIKESDILFSRKVSSDEEILFNYDKAFNSFQAQRAEIRQKIVDQVNQGK